MSRIIVVLLSFIISFSPVISQAAMMSSESIIPSQVDQILSNDQLMVELESMGVSRVQLESRLNSLSAEEQMILIENLENMPAGQDVLSMAFTIFIIFIITDIIGVTDLFAFVDPI